jgi:hypothetical protein
MLSKKSIDHVVISVFVFAAVAILYFMFVPGTTYPAAGPDCPAPLLCNCDHTPRATSTAWTQATETVLFNPLEPATARLHHPVFDHFQQYHGPFKRDYLTDFLGTETNFSWDCEDDPASSMHYSMVVPSRRVACERHAAQRKAGTAVVSGEMPLVDDEYEEFVDVLSAVVRTQRNFVIMELGARFGTWGVRALRAWHQLRGSEARATFVGVESDAQFFAWMARHVQHNNLTHESVLLHQYANAGEGNHLMALAQKGGVDHINYLDVDIQHAEGDFFQGEPTLAWMDTHVAVVHIGTHSDAIHAVLKARFDERGWILFFAYPLGYHGGGLTCDNHLVNALQMRTECMTETPFGKVYIRDGMLSYGNPKLVGNKAKDRSQVEKTQY